MADPAPRRRVRRRRWWRRSALPRSRPALAVGALVGVILLVLLLLGLTRAEPGRDLPPYDPASTTTVPPLSPRPLPEITRPSTIPVAPATAAPATTRRRP